MASRFKPSPAWIYTPLILSLLTRLDKILIYGYLNINAFILLFIAEEHKLLVGA